MGLEVQMAACGATCGSDFGDDLTHPYRLPVGDGDSLQVVVRGDEAVAVVDFHAVASTPRVPAHGPDHAGVGRVDEGAAVRGEVLAPVEFPRQSCEGVDPEPEGRAPNQHFKRCVQFPGARAV